MYLDSWLDGINIARDKEEQDEKKNPNFNLCVFVCYQKDGALQKSRICSFQSLAEM